MAGQLRDLREICIETGDTLAAVEAVQILGNDLGVEHLGARLGGVAVGGSRTGRQQAAAVRVVVVDAGGLGVAAGHLADHAGKRVGRKRRTGVAIAHTLVHKAPERIKHGERIGPKPAR